MGKNHSFFTTFVYQSPLQRQTRERSRLLRDIKEESSILMRTDQDGIRWSQKNYLGGYTSYGSLNQLHRFSTTFEKLHRSLNLHVRHFIDDLEWDVSLDEIQLTRMWINVMPSQTAHSFHLHPLSVVSGTFYVEMPRGTSPLKIEDPRLGFMMGSPPKKLKCRQNNRTFIDINAKPGDVVLFESWLRHEVPPNPSSQNRISVSFNYDWVGRRS